MSRKFELTKPKRKRGKTERYDINPKLEGIKEGRQFQLKEELIFLGFVLNTNDKYRIGEIEKRIEEIKKELAGVEE